MIRRIVGTVTKVKSVTADTIAVDNMNPPIFICSVCGELHTGILEERGKDLSDDERDKLRQTWYKAIEKLNRPGLNVEQLKNAEEVEIKSSAAYTNTHRCLFWSMPDSILTVRKDGKYILTCIDCDPSKPMSLKAALKSCLRNASQLDSK